MPKDPIGWNLKQFYVLLSTVNVETQTFLSSKGLSLKSKDWKIDWWIECYRQLEWEK